MTPRRPDGNRPTGRPRLAVTVAIAFGVALAVAAIPLDFLETAEWGGYDLRLRLRNSVSPQPLDDRIVLVGITERDRRLVGGQLASRAVHPPLVRTLAEGGAAVVGFDIFFEDRRPLDEVLALSLRSVPTVLAYRIDTEEAAGRPAGGMPAELAPAAEAIAAAASPGELRPWLLDTLPEYGAMLSRLRAQALDAGQPLAGADDERVARLEAWLAWLEREAAGRWMEWERARPAAQVPGPQGPITAAAVNTLSPPLLLAADGAGVANIDKTREAVVRRAPMVFRAGDTWRPSLGLAILCQYFGADFATVDVDWGRSITIHPSRHADGPVVLPIDGRGAYLVNYREGESFLRRETNANIALAAGFEGDPGRREAFARALDGAIVLVGEFIAGGGGTDVEPTPLDPAFSMVGMHANIIDNALGGDFVRRTSGRADRIGLAVAGLAVGLLFWRVRFPAAATLLAAGMAVYLVASQAVFHATGWALPTVRPFAASAAWAAGLFAYVVGVTERDRRVVKEVLLRSVSPRIGEEILRHYDREELWSARREITVLFVDIRGYTGLSERLGPDATLGVLERFYETASEMVFRHDGQVNKFLGDAVLALFGALPDEETDHAARAVRAAADIQRRMAAIAREMREPLATGAGVNTGEAVVGIVGRRSSRIEYTAIGDAVNVASRIQGLAVQGEIALGPVTGQVLGAPDGPLFAELGALAERLDGVEIRGRQEPVTLWKIKITHEVENQ